MKTILVTSDLTYVPQNYDDVLRTVLFGSKEHIAGVVIIKINKPKIASKVPIFYLLGCKRLASVLRGNLIRARLKKKQKIFQSHSIPILYTKSVNNTKTYAWIKKICPDLIFNMRARCIFKEDILKLPKIGCVNIHHGILPEQRGLFCDLYALSEERSAGFSIHEMTNIIDGGQIFIRTENKRNKNYMDYLMENSFKEGGEISKFINESARKVSLPEGMKNIRTNDIRSITPNYKTIRTLKKKGIKL